MKKKKKINGFISFKTPCETADCILYETDRGTEGNL